MALYKSAQHSISISPDEIKGLGDEGDVIFYEEMPTKEEVVELHEPKAVEVTFKLPPLPGSDAEMPIEVSTDEDVQVDEEKPKAKDKNDVAEGKPVDPWDWKSRGMSSIMNWAKERASNIPRHTGGPLGIQRAKGHLKRLRNELSKALSEDYNGEIDINNAEAFCDELDRGIERLEDAEEARSKGRKKKASDEEAFVKEAQKAPSVNGVVVCVPLHISAIARLMVNSMVSAGRDIERMFDDMVKKYKLDDREQLELHQHLLDMNVPLRRPRGYLMDEKIDPTSPDLLDTMQNYPS